MAMEMCPGCTSPMARNSVWTSCLDRMMPTDESTA